MFGFSSNKSKWNQMATSCRDYKLSDAIQKLFIPYDISVEKFVINMDCFNNSCDYSHEYGCGCTYSMLNWTNMPHWELPMGFPHWFYAAFPDVAKWCGTENAREYLEPIINREDSELSDSDCRLKVYVLKQVVDAYLSVPGNKLEVK